jgi:hypothetical protein
MAEQLTLNQRVDSSSLSGLTNPSRTNVAYEGSIAIRARGADRRAMYRRSVPLLRRALAAFLWFEAVGSGAGLVLYLSGLPRDLSLVVGLAAGAFVFVDPMHLLWDRQRVTVADLRKVTPDAPREQPEAVPATR